MGNFRKEMEIKLNITKKRFFIIISAGLLISAGLFVNAFGEGTPLIVGHSAADIRVTIGGADKTLQQSIDESDFEGQEGPVGPQGLQGLQGLQGSQGPVATLVITKIAGSCDWPGDLSGRSGNCDANCESTGSGECLFAQHPNCVLTDCSTTSTQHTCTCAKTV
jgi:hypothetical protein